MEWYKDGWGREGTDWVTISGWGHVPGSTEQANVYSFRKTMAISYVAEQLLASHEGTAYMALALSTKLFTTTYRLSAREILEHYLKLPSWRNTNKSSVPFHLSVQCSAAQRSTFNTRLNVNPSHIFNPTLPEADRHTHNTQTEQTNHFSPTLLWMCMCLCVFRLLPFPAEASQSQMMCPSPLPPPFAHSTSFFPPSTEPACQCFPLNPPRPQTRANTGTEKVVHVAQTHKLEPPKLTVSNL
jgi:hypothetical protein